MIVGVSFERSFFYFLFFLMIEALRANRDHPFHRAIALIEKKIKGAAEKIGGGGHWDATAKECLRNWTKFQSGAVKGAKGVLKKMEFSSF